MSRIIICLDGTTCVGPLLLVACMRFVGFIQFSLVIGNSKNIAHL